MVGKGGHDAKVLTTVLGEAMLVANRVFEMSAVEPHHAATFDVFALDACTKRDASVVMRVDELLEVVIVCCTTALPTYGEEVYREVLRFLERL